MITITIGPVYSQAVANSEEAQLKLVSVSDSLTMEDKKYVAAARRWITTGYKHFLDEEGEFRTGLLGSVLSLLLGPPKQELRIRLSSPAYSVTIYDSRQIGEALNRIFSKNANLVFHEEERLPIEYRPHLRSALEAFQVRPRGIWNMAVNSGKTFISAALCDQLRSAKILITVPYGNSGLAKQGFDNYKLDCKMSNVALVKGCDLSYRRIVWASLATINSKLKANRRRTIKWLRTFEVLIKDECHETSDVEEAIYDLMTCWARLGMSGTPYSKDAIKDTRTQGLYGPTIQRVSNSYLIENGYSAKPYVYCYLVQHKEAKKFGDYQKYTKYLRECTWRVKLVCDLATSLHDRGNRVVISCSTREEAAAYKKVLQRFGKTEVYTGNLKLEERKDMLRRFKVESTKFLIGTRIFSTGVSENSISALILASGSKKSYIQLQKIGRGLRKKDGTNRIVLVDLWDQVSMGLNQGKHRYKIWKSDKAFEVKTVNSLEEFQQRLEEDGN